MTGSEEGRFELRVWGELAEQRRKLVARGTETGRSSGSDLYLIGPNRATNAKIRDGALEIKHLVETDGILQRWRPGWSVDLPLDPSAIAHLWSDLDLGTPPEPAPGPLDEDDLRAELSQWPDTHVVLVHKSRRHFDYGEVTGEITRVKVEGADAVDSVVVESRDRHQLRRAAEALELAGPNRPVHEQVLRMVDRGH